MNNLKNLIKKSGLKQRYIASKIGLTASTITNYVTGRRKPRIDTAKKLAEILNCRVEDIFFEKNKH